jgi:Na+/glutamate symporter
MFGGGLFALLRKPARGPRIAAGALLATFGLVSGVLGALLVFLWSATNNDVAHKNANAFLSPVVALALVPVGIAFAMGRNFGRRWLERTLLACAALAGIGVVFALVVGHDVLRTGSFLIPVWLGALAGARFGSRSGAAQIAPPKPR